MLEERHLQRGILTDRRKIKRHLSILMGSVGIEPEILEDGLQMVRFSIWEERISRLR